MGGDKQSTFKGGGGTFTDGYDYGVSDSPRSTMPSMELFREPYMNQGASKYLKKNNYGVTEKPFKTGYKNEEELQSVIDALRRLGIGDLRENYPGYSTQQGPDFTF